MTLENSQYICLMYSPFTGNNPLCFTQSTDGIAVILTVCYPHISLDKRFTAKKCVIWLRSDESTKQWSGLTLFQMQCIFADVHSLIVNISQNKQTYLQCNTNILPMLVPYLYMFKSIVIISTAMIIAFSWKLQFTKQ